MRKSMLAATLLLAGCTVEGSYSSDALNTTGYPCRVQFAGKRVVVTHLEMECGGSDPSASPGAGPASPLDGRQ